MKKVKATYTLLLILIYILCVNINVVHASEIAEKETDDPLNTNLAPLGEKVVGSETDERDPKKEEITTEQSKKSADTPDIDDTKPEPNISVEILPEDDSKHDSEKQLQSEQQDDTEKKPSTESDTVDPAQVKEAKPSESKKEESTDEPKPKEEMRNEEKEATTGKTADPLDTNMTPEKLKPEKDDIKEILPTDESDKKETSMIESEKDKQGTDFVSHISATSDWSVIEPEFRDLIEKETKQGIAYLYKDTGFSFGTF